MDWNQIKDLVGLSALIVIVLVPVVGLTARFTIGPLTVSRACAASQRRGRSGGWSRWLVRPHRCANASTASSPNCIA